MQGRFFHFLTLYRYGTTRSYAIDRQRVLGRSEQVYIYLRDLRVSRLHCRVKPQGEFLHLEDISAANPTIVNGEPISGPVLLMVGDWVKVGPYDFLVEVKEDWIEQEPGKARFRQELQRLVRRAQARPILVLLLVLFVAAAAAFRTYRKKPLYDASVTFELKERRGNDGNMAPPPPKSQLRQYVFDGIFTRKKSLGVIKKFNLFASKMAIDPNWAIEEMRDQVNVSVFNNEFLIPDGADLPYRTARVRITYKSPNARLSLKIVRELGRLLREHEQKTRKHSAEAAVKFVRKSIRQTALKIDDLRSRQALAEVKSKNKKISVSERATALVEVQNINRLIDHLRDRLSSENTRMARVAMIAAREKNSLGIRFRVIDWGRMADPKLKRSHKAILTGLLVFLFGLPVIGLLVGVFDRRLYRPEDIERLGIVSLGQIDRYDGDDVGSFDQRQRSKEITSV